MRTIQSPLIYFGNREHSQKDCFEIIEGYQQKHGRFHCFYDLFSGSGSMALYAIANNLADQYFLNDLFAPLTYFWQQVKINPEKLIAAYGQLTKQYVACLEKAEQKHVPTLSLKKKKRSKKREQLVFSQTRADFYRRLQDNFNQTADAERTLPEYAALFAFIINHAQNGMPLLSEQDGSVKLECELVQQPGRLPIDEDFAKRINQVHQLFKDKNITFSHRDFRDFDQPILEEKGGHKSLVMLDPPYPDMPDAAQQPTQHIYQRSEPKSQLHSKLNGIIKILEEKDIPFIMFYGVLGMPNPCPIYWPQGHVLHQVASNPPYHAYTEHLYLSNMMTPFIPKHQKTIQPLFHQIFETHAQIGLFQNGERIALVWEEEEKTKKLTYAELNQAANQLAYYLLQQGLEEKLQARSQGAEPLVALYLDRGPNLIISILAIIKSGAAFLPIETNQDRLELSVAYQRIQQSQACMLLIDKKKLPADWGSEKIIAIDPQQAIRSNQLLAELKETKYSENLNRAIKPDDLVYVMYTSGSTGLPKGVEILQRGLPYAFESHQDLLNLGLDDHIAQFASIGFDASIMEIIMALGSGAQLHLVDDHQYSDSCQLTQFLQKHEITIAIQTPKMLTGLNSDKFPSLRALLIVGDSFTKELSDAWIRPITIPGKSNTLRQVINGYGLTETTICTTLDPCNQNKPLTIGRPILGLEVFLRSLVDEEKNLDWNLSDWSSLLDSQVLRKKQAEEIASQTALPDYLINLISEYIEEPLKGAIYVSGPGLARGYWQRPDLTQARFKEIKINGQNKYLYQTGDIGYYLADGNLVFTGRIDRQVKIRGQRVELGEIETIILKISDPVIQEVRVIAYTPLDSKNRSNVEKILVAYMVPKQSELIIDKHIPNLASLVALKKIRKNLRQQALSSMCPALNHMTFVANLPRKQNDKNNVDEGELLKRSVPCFSIPIEMLPKGLKPEIYELIEWIRGQWASALNLDIAEIPYTDFTFEELGGDSIRVHQCIAMIHHQSSELESWQSVLQSLTSTDVLKNDLLTLSNIIQQKQSHLILEEQERVTIERKLPSHSAQTKILQAEGIYRDKIYGKQFLVPIFCFHSMLGDAELDYKSSVLKKLKWNIQYISAPSILESVKGKGEHYLTILANYYIDKYLLKNGQLSEEVYWLLGWSTGGFIAKLVADQLRNRGKRVFIYLLDSASPKVLQEFTKETHAKHLLGKFKEKLNAGIACCLQEAGTDFCHITYDELQKLDPKTQIEYFEKRYYDDYRAYSEKSGFGDGPKRKSYEIWICTESLLKTVFELYRSELTFSKQMIPSLHPDDLLIATTESKKDYGPVLGWQSSTLQHTILIAGDHFNILNNENLYTILQERILQQVQLTRLSYYQQLATMEHDPWPVLQSIPDYCDFLENPVAFLDQCELAEAFKHMHVKANTRIKPFIYKLDDMHESKIFNEIKFVRLTEERHKKQVKNIALYHLYQGILYIHQQSYDRAIQSFNAAIKKDSNCSDAYFYLGAIYQQCQQDTDKALGYYEKYGRQQPKLPGIYLMVAYLLMKQQDYRQAEDKTDIAIALSLKEGGIFAGWKLRSKLAMRRGDLMTAFCCTRSGLELHPQNSELQCQLGKIYLWLRKYDLAIASFTQFIDKNNQFQVVEYKTTHTVKSKVGPEPYVHRGYCYLLSNRFNKALAEFNAALELDQNKLDGYEIRIKLYLVLNKRVEVIDDLYRLIKRFPAVVKFNVWLAGLLTDEARFIEAVQILRKQLNQKQYQQEPVIKSLGIIEEKLSGPVDKKKFTNLLETIIQQVHMILNVPPLGTLEEIVSEKKEETDFLLAMQTSGFEKEIEKYIKLKHPVSPRTAGLFSAVKNLEIDLAELKQSIDLGKHAVNTQSDDAIGETPLREILKRVPIITNSAGISQRQLRLIDTQRIQLLITAGALWQQPNRHGETAEAMIKEFTEDSQQQLATLRK